MLTDMATQTRGCQGAAVTMQDHPWVIHVESRGVDPLVQGNSPLQRGTGFALGALKPSEDDGRKVPVSLFQRAAKASGRDFLTGRTGTPARLPSRDGQECPSYRYVLNCRSTKRRLTLLRVGVFLLLVASCLSTPASGQSFQPAGRPRAGFTPDYFPGSLPAIELPLPESEIVSADGDPLMLSLEGTNPPTPVSKMPQGVQRFRKGFFQRLKFVGNSLVPSSDEDIPMHSLSVSVTVAVPLGSFENLLLVTPRFEVDMLDAPAGVDLPDQLYGTGVDLMWRGTFNDRWGAMVGFTPMYTSDMQTSSNALRFSGRAFATWQWVPDRLKLIFGVVYLDRNDIRLLPGIGLIWTPTPEWRYDLLFPRPKIARRIAYLPGEYEHWLFFGASLGGRTWAVQRESGLDDQLTARDYRLTFGWERIVEGGGGVFAEAGYVFGRELEYEDVPTDFSLGDALLLRAGITF